MLNVTDMVKGIYDIIDYVSKMGGNLDKTELWNY
jgi:hypothetical protein